MRPATATFDTPNRASFEIWVWIPKGDGRFFSSAVDAAAVLPDLLGRGRRKAPGYIACLYPRMAADRTKGTASTTRRCTIGWRGRAMWCWPLAQCGFGDRLLEGPDFGEKYPRWSRLGRMVYDVQRAVDFLAEGRGQALGAMPLVDRRRVYVLGYSLGGMVGLYATALDARLAGVASFCGFAALATDTSDRTTGGNRRLYLWHALLPKLGLFEGREDSMPSDFEEHAAVDCAPRRASSMPRAATATPPSLTRQPASIVPGRLGPERGTQEPHAVDPGRCQSVPERSAEVLLDWLDNVARTSGSPGDGGKKITSRSRSRCRSSVPAEFAPKLDEFG